MLSICKKQMEIFSNTMLKRFEYRLLEHLRERFPEQTKDLPDEKILFVVQTGMKKAETFGIIYEDDIRRFIEYLVIYGTRLDIREDFQWIGDILHRDDLNGTAKMDRIDTLELQVLRRQLCAG